MTEQKRTNIWSLVAVTIFVAIGVYGLEPINSLRQATTSWYSSHPGTITKLVVADEEFASIEYTFAINGKRYFGDRFSYCRRLDKLEIEDTLGPVRQGGPVTVYADQRQPAKCVLIRGLTSTSQFGLFWSVAASLCLVVAVMHFVLRNRSKETLKRQYADRVAHERGIKRLRMIPGGFESPAQVAVACVILFPALFYLLLESGDRFFGWWQLNVVTKLGISVALGVFAAVFDYFYTLRGNERGRWDLIIDEHNGTLQLPAIGAYGQPTTHQLRDIKGLELKTLLRPEACDNDEGLYRLNIICHEQRVSRIQEFPVKHVTSHAVAQSGNQTELDALSEWLQEAVGRSWETKESVSDGSITTLLSEMHATSQSRGLAGPSPNTDSVD